MIINHHAHQTRPSCAQAVRRKAHRFVRATVLKDLTHWLDTYGTLAVLRNGFKCYGRTLRVAFFKPAHGMNPELAAQYAANRVGVTRQLRYSLKNTNELDLVLSINGIPVVTAELKNPMTGQTVTNAIAQYQQDRDHREPLFEFKRRALVHFAVDTEQVFMTTQSAGGAGAGAGGFLDVTM